MNGNDFLNAMTDVADKHIIEAEKKPVKRRGLFIGAMSAAAAAVITVTAVSVNTRLGGNYTGNPSSVNNYSGASSEVTNGTAGSSVDTGNSVTVGREPRNDVVFPSIPNEPGYSNAATNNSTELPKLTPWYYSTGGMGGPTGSDEPETDSGNTWSAEMNIETLPVYHNFSESSEHDFMIQTLKCISETLGYDISEMKVEDNFFTEEKERRIRETWENEYGAPEEEIQRMINISKTIDREIIASVENEVKISLNLVSRLDVNVQWYYGNCFSIPDEYKPTSLTITEMDKAGRYILETYRNMFGISNPVLSVKSSSDNRVEYYEGGSDAEKFANYQLNRVVFEFNPKGDIVSMRFRAAGMKKVGDYPIVSVDKATERLYDNRFLSMLGTFGYDFSGTEPIGAVELVYLYRREHEYVMPYYHFEVGLTAEQSGFGESGEIRYFEYYVPAITDEYLGDWQSQSMGLPKE